MHKPQQAAACEPLRTVRCAASVVDRRRGGAASVGIGLSMSPAHVQVGRSRKASTGVAKLATSAAMERNELRARCPAGSDRVDDVLKQVAKRTTLVGALSGDAPGVDRMLDRLIRMDIERIDEILLAMPPWEGKDAEYTDELEALVRRCRTHAGRNDQVGRGRKRHLPRRFRCRLGSRVPFRPSVAMRSAQPRPSGRNGCAPRSQASALVGRSSRPRHARSGAAPLQD